MPSKARIASFLGAVLVSTALGSILQTQINLAELQALGAPVPMDVRVRTTGQDLLGFTPAYAGLVTGSFLVSLPAAVWVATRLGLRRPWPPTGWALHAVAAALGLAVAFQIADAVAPMPTLIAATRSVAGTACMLLSAVAGGLCFAFWPRRHREGAPA
jgi:MFS family permease